MSRIKPSDLPKRIQKQIGEKYGDAAEPKQPKYRNKKSDGYDSQKEKQRHLDLVLLEKAGLISDLRRQVPFQLIPAQYDKNKGLLELSVQYISDFVYFDKVKQETVVEDCKGVRTKDYIIKRKLMLERHGIRISEV